ncbi:MAG: diacylglycerol kinase family lipid kinase [Candidatus Wallbacteria bacterium]|nr:diacylglycerol kinase family lipid kinase [Candidatus Wallbacteria bacterium]
MTAGYRTFVVVNPRSAAGSTGRMWPEIEACLKASLGQFEHAFTDRQGGGAALAARALQEGYEMIVAVGGDGTLNEVVNGMFDVHGAPIRPGAVVGTLARGTGKDFVKTAGIPKDLEAAAAALAGRAVRPWDVGRITLARAGETERVQYFVNESDFGIGGEISRRVNASSKALGGFISFLWATLMALFSYRSKRVRIRCDGKDLGERQITSVVVAVGRFGGGGMMLAPPAVPDDGLLDLVVMPEMRPLEAVNNIARLYDGSLLSHPRVEHHRCTVVEATSDEKVRLGVDGESEHCLPARFEVLPRAIQVKVPGER